MSKVEKKEIRITNIDVDTHDYFCDTAKNLKLDKKQLFDLLLNTYQFFNFKLSEEEKETLKYINNTVPDIFQKKISHLMQGLAFVLACIDDVLLMSPGKWNDHIHKLDQVLNQMS